MDMSILQATRAAYGLLGNGSSFDIVKFIFEKVFKKVFRDFVYKVFRQKVIYIIDSFFSVRPVLCVPENSLGRNEAVAVMSNICYGEPYPDTAGNKVIFIDIRINIFKKLYIFVRLCPHYMTKYEFTVSKCSDDILTARGGRKIVYGLQNGTGRRYF